MGMMIKCTRTHVKTDPATLRRAARALFCVKNENFCSTFWWLIATFCNPPKGLLARLWGALATYPKPADLKTYN